MGKYCGISVCNALEIEFSCCQFIDFLYCTARWSMRRTGGDNSCLAFLFAVWQVAAAAMKQRQYIGNMWLLYFNIPLMHLMWAYYGRRNKSKYILTNLHCWLYFYESNYTYGFYVPYVTRSGVYILDASSVVINGLHTTMTLWLL